MSGLKVDSKFDSKTWFISRMDRMVSDVVLCMKQFKRKDLKWIYGPSLIFLRLVDLVAEIKLKLSPDRLSDRDVTISFRQVLIERDDTNNFILQQVAV